MVLKKMKIVIIIEMLKVSAIFFSGMLEILLILSIIKINRRVGYYE